MNRHCSPVTTAPFLRDRALKRHCAWRRVRFCLQFYLKTGTFLPKEDFLVGPAAKARQIKHPAVRNVAQIMVFGDVKKYDSPSSREEEEGTSADDWGVSHIANVMMMVSKPWCRTSPACARACIIVLCVYLKCHISKLEGKRELIITEAGVIIRMNIKTDISVLFVERVSNYLGMTCQRIFFMN